MFYVKAEIAEGVTIQAEVTHENVYNRCPKCGAETPVDLADLATDGRLDLYGTAVYCKECSEEAQAECEREEAQAECEREHEIPCSLHKEAYKRAGYFNRLSDAIETATEVWDADGISPREQVFRLQKAFPEALPNLPSEAFMRKETLDGKKD